MTVMRLLMPILLLCPLLARAAITDPWPAADEVRGVRVIDVRFPSTSPFNPRALLSGDAPAATAIGRLYLPPTADASHRVPAVVLLHGAIGMVAERGETYGPPLAAMGVAVLVVDTFGARRAMGTGFAERLIHITETTQVADAYAGLRYLASRPEVDARRVVLTGFSYGGMSTIFAMNRLFADRLAPPPAPRFVGHVAFYAPCIARFADPVTTGAPLLMLYGKQDALIRPDRCEEIADDLRRGRSDVRIIAYDGAVHEWDGPLERRMIGRDLTPCRFRVERDGTIHDVRTGLPMSGPLTRTVELLLCVRNRPYPIGHDDRVLRLSDRDYGAFLTRVLQPK